MDPGEAGLHPVRATLHALVGALTVATLVVPAVAAPAPVYAGNASSERPPERFTRDFAGPLTVRLAPILRCDGGVAPNGYSFVGCTTLNPVGNNGLALQNPCDHKFLGESYAKYACHELGHLNGWSVEHEK